MNDAPPVVEHLRKLAEDYRTVHLELQERYREMNSLEEFLAELRQREAALLDRFRLVQQQLIGALQDESLTKMLDLSRIFDEMRVISLFTVQALAEARKTVPVSQEHKE